MPLGFIGTLNIEPGALDMITKHSTAASGSSKPAAPGADAAPLPAKPFLKWAGGKRQLLPAIRAAAPAISGRYFEPFVGGGAVFFDLAPPRAVISDANVELVNCYTVVRDRVDALVAALRNHVYERDHFYRVRALRPESLDPVERAARTIYLNKTGFNGLYRVNSKGIFNVPFGRFKNPNFCDEPTLRACARRLAGVTILSRPFEEVVDDPAPGEFVYLDPPYVPVSRTAYFTAYSNLKFDLADQERLAVVFERLAARGVKVMLSNSDVEWVRNRYARFNVQNVLAPRSVNSDVSARGLVRELLVTSY
jgi:DNA adenine methylase